MVLTDIVIYLFVPSQEVGHPSVSSWAELLTSKPDTSGTSRGISKPKTRGPGMDGTSGPGNVSAVRLRDVWTNGVRPGQARWLRPMTSGTTFSTWRPTWSLWGTRSRSTSLGLSRGTGAPQPTAKLEFTTIDLVPGTAKAFEESTQARTFASHRSGPCTFGALASEVSGGKERMGFPVA
jgi:hypothetical protein